MTTTLASIYTLADRIILPAVNDGIINEALRIAAHDFCERTGAWRETIMPDALEDDDTSAQLTLAADIDGTIGKLISVSADDGTDQIKEWDQRYLRLDDNGLLSWEVYTSVADIELSVIVSVLPDITCYQYPAKLIQKWGSALVAGALAWLYAYPGEIWTNERKALEQAAIFERQIDRAAMHGANKMGRKFFSLRPPARGTANTPGPLAWQQYYKR